MHNSSDGYSIFSLHAAVLRALSHPERLQIIQLLRIQAMSVTQLYQMLDLPQPKISQHLMVLRKHHIVTAQRKGKRVWYALADERYSTAHDAIRSAVIARHRSPEISETFQSLSTALNPMSDPVCGMQLSAHTAAFTFEHAGTSYVFCGSGCLKHFQSNPEHFLRKVSHE